MSAIDNYYQQLLHTLEEAFSSQKAALEDAAACMAESLKNGGMIYTFGTGHGHLLALEVFYRAGGLAKVTPILDERLMLHVSAAGSTLQERREDLVPELMARYPVKEGDVLLVFSNSGRNAVPVLLAMETRRRGARVIAFTSMRHSSAVTPRNSAGKRLYETADICLDNKGVMGDAALAFPDGSMVGPTSTAVGAALLQALVCRVKEISVEQHCGIEFFVSSNIDGGDAVNEKLIEKYRDLIPSLLREEA